MKNLSKNSRIFTLLAAVALLPITALAAPSKVNPIVGKWVEINQEGVTAHKFARTFSEDGSQTWTMTALKYTSFSCGTYITQNGLLTLTNRSFIRDGHTMPVKRHILTVHYIVNGDTLTITQIGGHPTIWHRVKR